MQRVPETESIPDPVRVSLSGLCPRCGSKTLFDGAIRFATRCTNCGLDFSTFNVDDGPAAFLTTIIGTLLVIGVLVLEATVGPPFWVHAVLWVPLTTVAVVASLRVAKAALLFFEYKNAAREGRIIDQDRA